MSEGYTQRFSRQGWKQKRVRLRQSSTTGLLFLMLIRSVGICE